MVKKNNEIAELVKSTCRLRDINKAISNYLEENFRNMGEVYDYRLSIVVTLNDISKDIIDELSKLIGDLQSNPQYKHTNT